MWQKESEEQRVSVILAIYTLGVQVVPMLYVQAWPSLLINLPSTQPILEQQVLCEASILTTRHTQS